MSIVKLANSPVSYAALQAGIMAQRSALQLQSYVGTDAQRADWFVRLDQADMLAQAAYDSVASLFSMGRLKLWRAVSILRRVESQTTAAGLLIAGLQDGLAANAARFRPSATPSTGAEEVHQVYILKEGLIREERDDEKARRLVKSFLESDKEAHRTLIKILNRAFDAHIAKLDRQVASIDEVIRTGVVPEDASYPRYFDDAQPELMNLLENMLLEFNGEVAIPRFDCIMEIVHFLIRRKLDREKIDPNTTDEAKSKRGEDIVLQIPAYSAYQLLCLLMLIRDGIVDGSLVEQLRHTHNGFEIETRRAIAAGVRFGDLLRASKLIGSTDIIDANINMAYELAMREQPQTDPRIVRSQVKAAVARLVKARDSSSAETDPDCGLIVNLFK